MGRVVITGMGPITPLGIGKEEFWKNSLEGKPGTERIPFDWFDPEKFDSHVCATVKDFDPSKYGIREGKTLDRVTLFALAGTYLALEDAGVDFTARKGKAEIRNLDLDEACVIISSGIGGFNTVTEEHEKYMLERIINELSFLKKYYQKFSEIMDEYDFQKLNEFLEQKIKKLNYFVVSKLMPNAPSAQVSIMYGIKGEARPVGTACASGKMSIGDLFRLIASGKYRWGLAGGVESCFGHDGLGFKGFDVIPKGALSTAYNENPEKTPRPFDKDRDGFVLAEGAGVVMLEELEHALAREAHIYAEIIGYDANSDAYSIMAPGPDATQIINLMRSLLRKSKIDPKEVQYFNAHGTSTEPNDRIETLALKEVFGKHAYGLNIAATKSRIGHSIAASGAVETIETALVIDRGIIAPTINYETPDPDCDLNYTPNEPVKREVENAVTTSYGFGGHNAGLVVSKLK